MRVEDSSTLRSLTRMGCRVPRVAVIVWVSALLACHCGCTNMREWRRNGYKVGPEYCPPAVTVAEDWIDSTSVRLRHEPPENSEWWTAFGPTCRRTVFQRLGDRR